MILLKRITLTNFLSHEKTEIDFSSSEKALIDGASGVGKSSIFDAIVWALYGEGRAENRSLVRKSSKRGSVSLELVRRNDQEIKEDVVIITRSVTSAGKHTLEVAIEQADGSRAAYPLSGVRELQAWIDKELIGASYLLFINSIAYVQGNTESFVAQTASKRKELLLEIVKAEDYRKYYENARQRLATLDNDHSRLLGQISELEANLASIQVQLKDRSEFTQAIIDNTKLLAEIEPKIKALEEKKAEMSALLKTVDILDEVLRKALSDREVAVNVIASKQFKIADKPRLLGILGAIPSYVTSIEETTASLHESRAKLSAASEQEAKRNDHYAKKPRVTEDLTITYLKTQLESNSSLNNCSSGEACPHQKGAHKFAEDTRAEIIRLKEKQTKENLALAEWAIEEAKLPPATDVRTLVKDIGETETHLKNLESEMAQIKLAQRDIDAITVLESEMPALQRGLAEKDANIRVAQKKKEDAEKSAKIDEINTVDNDLLSARAEEDNFSRGVSMAEFILKEIDRSEKEIISIGSRKSVAQAQIVTIQEDARKVGMVKEAFSSKGIETLVCDYILPKLEEKINKVLGKLSDFTIRLDTQRKTADGEGVVEGLFILLYNEQGEELPYESYSGGEKVRITFAISEAFASLGQQKIGFRCVDEAVLALDSNSLESFLEVVETLLSDFSQVLFISHIQDVKDLFDQKINIVKHNGISEISKGLE